MTYTSFIAALRALTVTGVVKKYDSSPTQLSTAVMPLSYVRLPEGSSETATFDAGQGLFNCAGELVVVMKPVMQSTNATNMDAGVTMMDAVHTALENAARANQYDRWAIRLETEIDGDTAYWRVIARVEASG